MGMTGSFSKLVLPVLAAALGGAAAGSGRVAQRPPGAGPIRVAAPAGAALAQDPSCLTAECHRELQGLRVSHGPVVLGRCDDCHVEGEGCTPYQEGEDHVFGLRDLDGRLCGRCHPFPTHEAVVHYPLRGQRCVICHDPHGSEHEGMMRFERTADVCFQCHRADKLEAEHVHAPARVGACETCHDPHGSPNALQLVAAGSRLCLRCHEDVAENMASHRHLHRVMSDDCSECHRSHVGEDPFLLKGTAPDLCLDCHEELAARIEHAPLRHKALDDETSCMYCHDAHASDMAGQLVKSPIELCLSCHDRELVGEERVLRDMNAFLAANPVHHGPIRNGDCSACHDSHASSLPHLLPKEYSETYYAAFDVAEYSLCFTCHEPAMVLEEESETVTEFRDGKKNLHFVHVNRAEKGRTCRACHDVHASKRPKHVRDTVAFGFWEMPIDFQIWPDGGSCGSGCHEPRSYWRTPERKDGPQAQGN